MRRPHHRINPGTIIFMLITRTTGLSWSVCPISRLTSRSVFVRLSTGEVQLPRRSLERHGRCDVVSGTYVLTPFALPALEERMAS